MLAWKVEKKIKFLSVALKNAEKMERTWHKISIVKREKKNRNFYKYSSLNIWKLQDVYVYVYMTLIQTILISAETCMYIKLSYFWCSDLAL